MDNVDQYVQLAIELAIEYAPQLILAILTLVIGMWIINRVLMFADKSLQKKFDPTLTKFVHSLASVLMKALLLISVASMVGIATTSFIAVLGAAGLAVGLALQGNLSNFASGVLILVFKPFKVGDVIEGAGFVGTVREIQIFTTVLMTFDNRKVIIPNSNLSNNPLINISAESTRRVDMKFGIGYGDDIDKAKGVINSLIEADSRILKDPAPVVVVSELADSSVNITVRTWAAAEDYWGIYFDMQENVKKRFDEEGVSIPFPQRDVHIYQETQ
ncbi:mechanosensitive ion channel family protein [Hahella ganghwensis]|uniref:mechanosensitive ion channel family protein n=1 Tax=Hahella ganghwensis TaxID=286420 RepID=UPI000376C2B8|nr:mechanosensitive ion channel domain-containing protein [Hahella ganghwensis]